MVGAIQGAGVDASIRVTCHSTRDFIRNDHHLHLPLRGLVCVLRWSEESVNPSIHPSPIVSYAGPAPAGDTGSSGELHTHSDMRHVAYLIPYPDSTTRKRRDEIKKRNNHCGLTQSVLPSHVLRLASASLLFCPPRAATSPSPRFLPSHLISSHHPIPSTRNISSHPNPFPLNSPLPLPPHPDPRPSYIPIYPSITNMQVHLPAHRHLQLRCVAFLSVAFLPSFPSLPLTPAPPRAPRPDR